MIAALLHLAIASARWYEQRGYQQQAAAAHQALAHLQAGYRQAATPVLDDLARHTPRPETVHRLTTAVRQAMPEHADRILTDPHWPALATTLAQVETAGHHLPTLLRHVAVERELDSAHSAAEVITWRLTSVPNLRTAAARARSTGDPASPGMVEPRSHAAGDARPSHAIRR